MAIRHGAQDAGGAHAAAALEGASLPSDGSRHALRLVLRLRHTKHGAAAAQPRRSNFGRHRPHKWRFCRSDGSRHGSPSCIAPSPCEAWSSRSAAASIEFWPSSASQMAILSLGYASSLMLGTSLLPGQASRGGAISLSATMSHRRCARELYFAEFSREGGAMRERHQASRDPRAVRSIEHPVSRGRGG